MTIEIGHVVLCYQTAQYDGTNGEEICTQFTSTFDYDNGTTLRFLDGDSNQWDVLNGQWLLWVGTSFYAVLDDVPQEPYQRLIVAEAIEASFGALGLVKGSGSTSIPASTLGQTDTYDVTLSQAMPNTSYAFFPQLRGAPSIISGHAILSATIIDSDTVRVTVQSGVGSLSGSSVFVQAWELAS